MNAMKTFHHLFLTRITTKTIFGVKAPSKYRTTRIIKNNKHTSFHIL